MKLTDATKMVKEMINQYVPGAEFAGYSSSKRTLGQAGIKAGRQYIKLSMPFVQIADEAAVRNTIAHECAHLLAFRRFGTLAHDRHFYAMCDVTGARAERLNKDKKISEALSVSANYRLVLAGEDGKVAEVLSNTYQKRPRKDITECWLTNNRSSKGRLWYCAAENAKIGKTIVKGLFFQK